MPVYEPEKKGCGWAGYLAAGCGGCLLLAVIAVVGMGLYVRHAVSRVLKPTVKRTGSYHYHSWSSSPQVSFALPDGSTLSYAHYLPGMQAVQVPGEGERALRWLPRTGKSQEWPLPYSQQMSVRVGVYWHSAKNGQGPFVRFFDATTNSVLDLRRREVGSVERPGAKSYMADYAYDDYSFTSGFQWSSSGSPPMSANGKPAIDITRVVKPSNCTYLGSIIRKGNALVFVPASRRP